MSPLLFHDSIKAGEEVVVEVEMEEGGVEVVEAGGGAEVGEEAGEGVGVLGV